VLGAQPVVQGLDVDGPAGVVPAGGWVVAEDPAVDGWGQRVGLAGLALPPILRALPAHVVADGALGDAEGLGNLGVGLPLVFEDLECHDFLRGELGAHRLALLG
jgi:hypothetical protein